MRVVRRMVTQVLMAVAVLPCITEEAHAHSTIRFVSTPLSPPAGYVWVRVAFVVLAVGAGVLIGWRLRRWRGVVLALVLTSASVAAFGFGFYRIGWLASNRTTAPPPGLGPPCRVLLGLGWREAGGLFLKWNAAGVLLFVVACFPWAVAAALMDRGAADRPMALPSSARGPLEAARGPERLKAGFPPLAWKIGRILLVTASRVSRTVEARLTGRTRKRRAGLVILASVVVYLVCLTPYLATGAWVHGGVGGYVLDECDRQADQLGVAIALYARDNEGRMPSERSMAGVFGQIRRYLEHDTTWRDDSDTRSARGAPMLPFSRLNNLMRSHSVP